MLSDNIVLSGDNAYCYQLETPSYQLITLCYQLKTPCHQVITPCYQLIIPCYQLITPCYQLITPYYHLIIMLSADKTMLSDNILSVTLFLENLTHWLKFT
jgi:hypothetical protein